MILAIISDIHGNHDALVAVLRDIKATGADRIVCLGDCIGYGPAPQQVIDTLKELKIPTIIGNHEMAAFDMDHRKWFNPGARRSLEMSLDKLTADGMQFIRELPTSLIVEGSRCVHGFPPDSAFTYLFQKKAFELQAALTTMAERICFVGHTHDLEIVWFTGTQVERCPLQPGTIQLVSQYRYIINVGSVGQPRDGSPQAKYLLWDKPKDRIEVRAVAYDNLAVADKILAAGMPEEHARRLRR